MHSLQRPKRGDIPAGFRSMQTPSMKDADEVERAQRYFIAGHVHLCEAGNQVIFLDLRRDKYLAIGRAERQALSGVVSGWCTSDTVATATSAPPQRRDDVIRSMLKLGLLTTNEGVGKAAASPVVDLVTEVLVDDDFERNTRAGVGAATAFLFACARAKAALTMQPFERVVGAVRRRKEKSATCTDLIDLAKCRELVSMFDRLRPFVFTSKDACLFDSLALIEFLALHKTYPTWLIGVTAQPFAAHSWVQHHRFVLNGSVEYVRRYTPILAV